MASGLVLPRHDEFWRAQTPREARNRLVAALRLELLGPEAPDEQLHESPLTRYVAGTLAPFGTDVPEEERDDQLTGDGEDEEAGAVDFGPPVSQALTPSSIGLSFLVSASTKKLQVIARWGDYRVEELPDEAPPEGSAAEEHEGVPEVKDDKSQAKRRRRRLVWVRTPREYDSLVIPLDPGKGLQRQQIAKDDVVTLEHLCRRLGDHYAVSVFLVNRREKGERARPPVDRWVFQPVLKVESPSKDAVFLPRELEPALAHSDRDRESNRLLFRGRREFAVGHGCAAEWSEDEQPDRARAVYTELIPQYELPKVEPRDISGSGLDMAALAAVRSADELGGLLRPLAVEYKKWIDAKAAAIGSLQPDLHAVAHAHLEECTFALGRMQRGIDALAEDQDAFLAFRFANRAMLLQRSHTVWARQRCQNASTAPAAPRLEGRWRPFQLAFILLNLSGLIHPESDDRHIGDLLWFPTGGGKTEAYLGLAAFTMALRRRRTIGGMSARATPS